MKSFNPLREILTHLRYLQELGYSEVPKDYFSFPFLFRKTSETSDFGFEELLKRIKSCTSCDLHRIRKQVVIDTNFNNKSLMLIGEYPDREDDFSGEPFSGAIKETLQKMLLSIGLKKEDFYCSLVVKCKPPAGRLPEDEEITTCKNYIFQEIKVLKPKLILALGNLPVKIFYDEPLSLSSVRGSPFKYRNSMIIFTYHPNYMLKNPAVKRAIWEDLKTFKRLYEEIFG